MHETTAKDWVIFLRIYKKEKIRARKIILFNSLTLWQAGGGHGRIQGTTHYDALRIIESTDGIYIKLSDGTFSRSSFINNGDTHQLYYTVAHDCSGVFRTSTADLGRTNFRFLSSVAETYKPAGWRAYGEGSLSSNNQRLTVRSSGLCGSTKTNLPNYMVPIEFINFWQINKKINLNCCHVKEVSFESCLVPLKDALV